TIRQVLGLLRVPRLNVNKAIGIKQQKELKKMSEKTKKSIRIALSFAQVVVQSFIVYYAYNQYKLSKQN
ncbi:hypothetical protein A4P65_15500, partial [Listeria monocytogenes]|uniref:hypothetical protein n=1 Tax=Listeria monocytogenes TaxID=1639 RepID=UPI000BE03D08